MLYILLLGYSKLFEQDDWIVMMDCISGYGLGASSIALFGRVGMYVCMYVDRDDNEVVIMIMIGLMMMM